MANDIYSSDILLPRYAPGGGSFNPEYPPGQAYGPSGKTPTLPKSPRDEGPTDSGGGGGGDGGKSGAGEPLIDWRSWLEDWGFPSEVINTLDAMAKKYAASQADFFVRDAILYLRGTDWHKKMFPGFSEGFRSGVIQNERDYRLYLNSVNDAYKRFFTRDITGEELKHAFTRGWRPERVEGELTAGAFVQANRGDIQYLLGAFDEGQQGEEGLLSLGRQQVGIGSALGQDLLRRVALAQLRLRRVFEGTLATPALGIEDGRLTAPSLARGTLTPDIGR